MGRSYRVLAADDEYWGRESLKSLLSWKDYGLEMLEPACDGEEVLSRMEKDKPDIILTDIDMPFMDGLELMRRLGESYPDVICIAVSGYDDFDKVKGFFRSGGNDYLLKPVGKEELVKVLTSALATLEKRQQEQAHQQERQGKVSSYMEDSEFSALLNEQLYGGRGGPAGGRAPLFSAASVILVKFHDVFRLSADYGHDMGHLSYLLKGQIRSVLPSGEGEKPPVIFNYVAKMSEFLMVGEFPPSWLEEVPALLESKFPLPAYGPMTVVVHPRSISIEDLGTIYREMMATVVTRPFARSSCVLTCSQDQKFPDFEEHLDHRMEVELIRQMEGRNWQTVRKLALDRTGFSQCLSGKWTVLETEQFLARLSSCLDQVVRKNFREMYAALEDALATFDQAKRCLDPDLAVKTLRDFLNSFDEGETLPVQGETSDQLLRVKAFLEENYGESITLPVLSKEFHMDPNYLSRSYSQRFGETITASLTRIRISHAIALMHEAERKLESISFLVGYDDYNYFSRVFRKKVGKSPSEYRKEMVM